MNKALKIAATLRLPAELIAQGLAPEAAHAELEKVAARYAVAVTPAVAELIDLDDPDDPIARQYIPSADELVAQPNENADPIGDHTHSPVDGIVHRYPDRVLFKLVHVCAVYCRFCFRREMVGPGKENSLSRDAVAAALDPHLAPRLRVDDEDTGRSDDEEVDLRLAAARPGAVGEHVEALVAEWGERLLEAPFTRGGGGVVRHHPLVVVGATAQLLGETLCGLRVEQRR